MSTGTQRQFLLFAAAGGVGFVVDTAVLYALAPWLGWYAARILSFLAAATTTWRLNRRYAFAPGDQKIAASWKEYRRYLLAMSVGGCVNYAAYLAVLHWTRMPGAAMLGVAVGSCCGLIFNFAASRYLVFVRHQRP